MSNQGELSIDPSSRTRKYDVFLSFRGDDTRKNFTDHLHTALRKSGIHVFKDDKELEKGKSISPELCKAIEESRISIIVFSRNYASSTWCLDELIKIAQCMKINKQTVIPVFYDVDPSVVRKQSGKFQEAFANYEEVFREHIEKVQNWRIALKEVADLSGWDLKDRHESEFIQDIVREIARKLGPSTLGTFEDLVGVDLRLKQLNELVGTRLDDVCMIGIYGMGGIGKTTIARAFYDLISWEFEGSSFLANVRETSEKYSLVHLQKQLLCQVVHERDIDIWNVYDGICLIKSRLQYKKVLIVIDDVDDIKQLNNLAGKQNWFGSGSMIIITTRDKHLLATYGVEKLYEATILNDDEAIQLFSLKAFKNYQPLGSYMELSNYILKYAGGHPLALEVLGSFLFGKTLNEWQCTIQRLGQDCEKGIFDTFQISFDGLKETEKKLFLDVACFFKGQQKDYVTRILDGCGFNPVVGISVLVSKCLITIPNENVLWMHDLLQEMGQQIVKRESLEQPGQCSRLWNTKDIHDVLAGNKGTTMIEGIMLQEKLQHITASAQIFSKMTNLRLLKISGVLLPKGLEYLSNNLSLLEWHGYPLKCLPSSLQLNKIVELKLHYSRIELLWKETRPLNKLKVISLVRSKNLKKTPDFTEAPSLEELILEGCTRLCEIHPSVLVHKKLILLNLKDCTSLTALPRKMDMESLKKLVLCGCLKLKKFPEIVSNMENLKELFLNQTPIKEVSFPAELFKGIVLLSLKDCKHLVSLPSNINGLKSLKTLDLSGCSKLENVPETLGQVECLEKLDLSGTAIRQPVSSIFGLKNLKELSFRGCRGPPSNSWYMGFPLNFMSRRNSNPMGLMLPSLSGSCSLKKLDLSNCNMGDAGICREIGNLVSLKELHLENNNFASLPGSIICLTNLERLWLSNCKQLQSLPELPLNLIAVEADNCTSLEAFPNLLKSRNTWIYIGCLNCFKMTADCKSMTLSQPKGLIPSPRAEISNITIPGNEIPEWFSHQNEGGSSVRITSHQNLRFKGFFACVVFANKQQRPCDWHCRFSCRAEEGGFTFYHRTYGYRIITDHLWLIYIPIWKIHKGPQKNWYEFEFRPCGCPEGIVRRCAAHPVYEEEDVDEFNHPTDECSSSVSGNVIEFHQDFGETSKTDDVATTKRSLADSVGAETTEVEEEPQSKRLKNFEE